MVESITAVAYIQEMEGLKILLCKAMTYKIRVFANESKIWVSSAHLQSKLNTIADAESRKVTK